MLFIVFYLHNLDIFKNLFLTTKIESDRVWKTEATIPQHISEIKDDKYALSLIHI